MSIKTGSLFVLSMISLWLLLLTANCIPLSGDLAMDEVLKEKEKSNYLESAVEQKIVLRRRYEELWSHRLWQVSHIFSNGFAEINRTINVLDYKPSTIHVEQIKPTDKSRINNAKTRKLVKMRKRRNSEREHDILLEDISYGIFGSCYNISLFSNQPFVMIDSCPLDAINIHDVDLCHSSSSFDEFSKCSIDLELVPVTDSRGYVYKNIYCARCHSRINVTTWEVELSYNSMSALRLFENDQSLTVLGKLTQTAHCTPSVYPLKPKGLLLCKDLKYHGKPLQHSTRYIHPSDENHNSEEYPLSFQILMNFGINGKGHVFFSTSTMGPIVEHPCGENEIYDPKVQECRRVVCKSGYDLIDKKCMPQAQNIDTFSEHDLSEAARSEYPLQITYRINVTKENINLLEGQGACVAITKSFAEMLNISIDRIFNFRITLLNETSPKKAMEIRQLPASSALNEQNILKETGESQTFCDANENDDVFVSHDDFKLTETVEFTFSLSPSKNKSTNYSCSESLKTKIQNLQGSFNFEINGTKFSTQNSAATTDVELDLWCTKGKQDQKFDKEFDVIAHPDEENRRNVTGVYVNSTGKFYPPGMYDLWVWVTGKIGNISDVTTNVYVFVCDMPKIENKKCIRFQIDSSAYIRLQNNSVLLNDKRIVNMNEYEYVSKDSYDIQICVPDSFLIEPAESSISFGCGEQYKNVLLAEGYISFALGIISIVVLAAVIITYSLFKKLRNLPGLNTMCLTLTLFLGELLFTTSGSIDQDSVVICPIVGVCLHFIFLASFFWMNVMSFDVFRTFANKCILTRVRKKERYFPRYSMYAWGTPAIIVGICCVLDFTNFSPNVKIGYGGSLDVSDSNYDNIIIENKTETSIALAKLSKQKFGCWIQRPVAALVAFGLPMILILFVNAIMFVKTIICITSVKKFVSLSTRRSSVGNTICHHDVMLYVRMSTVMGFTWIIGLASSIVSSFTEKPTNTVCITLHVLGLLFIIFNCSQGLFIFFVFVLNKRVGALYKNLFSQWKKNISRPSSSTSLSYLQTVASVHEETRF